MTLRSIGKANLALSGVACIRVLLDASPLWTIFGYRQDPGMEMFRAFGALPLQRIGPNQAAFEFLWVLLWLLMAVGSWGILRSASWGEVVSSIAGGAIIANSIITIYGSWRAFEMLVHPSVNRFLRSTYSPYLQFGTMLFAAAVTMWVGFGMWFMAGKPGLSPQSNPDPRKCRHLWTSAALSAICCSAFHGIWLASHSNATDVIFE